MFVRTLSLSVLWLSLIAPVAEAQIFHYVDQSGRKIYVDSPAKIPHQYRDNVVERSHARPAEGAPSSPVPEKVISDNPLRAEYEEAISALEQPIRFDLNRMVVPVTLSYGAQKVTLDLVVDTGASRTVVHRDAISSLNAYISPAGTARIADGSLVKTKKIQVDTLSSGPYTMKKATVLVLEQKGGAQGSQGLLGMDMLGQVHYELDKKRQMLIWEPEKYRQLQKALQKLDEDAAKSAAKAEG